MRSTFQRPSWLPQVFPGRTHMKRHKARSMMALAAILVLGIGLEWILALTVTGALLLVDDMLDGPGEDRS